MSPFYRTIWGEAAADAGAQLVEVGRVCFEIRKDGFVIRLQSNTTSLDDPVTARIAGDKELVYRLLKARNIPVPNHFLVGYDDLTTAWERGGSLKRPLVVKPARDTSGGNGVTTGVTRRMQLAKAMAFAGSLDDEVLIEEQVAGDTYRLLFLDGALLDAVVRSAPTVRGDGRSSIRRLIEEENSRRIEQGLGTSRSLIDIDNEVRNTLQHGGYSLRSIPPEGTVVRVKNVINDNRGSDNDSATGRLCASVIEESAAAAAAVGVRLAGVDLITPDPGVPLVEAGGAIVDVNTGPGLYHHYYNQSGGVPVAKLILARLLEKAGGP